MECSICIFGDIWRGLNDYNMMAGIRKFVTENWFFLFMTVFPFLLRDRMRFFLFVILCSVCQIMI